MPDPTFDLGAVISVLTESPGGAWNLHDVAVFLGGIEYVALIAMVIGLLVAAGLWGFAACNSQLLVGHRAQRVVAAVVVVGATVIGGASHLVSWAFGFGAFA